MASGGSKCQELPALSIFQHHSDGLAMLRGITAIIDFMVAMEKSKYNCSRAQPYPSFGRIYLLASTY